MPWQKSSPKGTKQKDLLAKAAREYLAKRKAEQSPLRVALANAVDQLAKALDEKSQAQAEQSVARIEAALLHEQLAAILTGSGTPQEKSQQAAALMTLGTAARTAHGHGRQALGIGNEVQADELKTDLDVVLKRLMDAGEIGTPTIALDAGATERRPKANYEE